MSLKLILVPFFKKEKKTAFTGIWAENEQGHYYAIKLRSESIRTMCDGESLCSEYRTTFKNSKTAILTDKLGIIYFLKIQMGGKFKKKKKFKKQKVNQYSTAAS